MSESHGSGENEQANLVYVFGLLSGGLILGFGLMSLYYSFGYEAGPLNQNFKLVGFSGIDNLWLLPAADYSFGLIVLGAMILVLLNSQAWKRTGGY